MNALFISYNGATEPLIQSQGIPYLKGLSGKGVKCYLLSFEKTGEGRESLKKELAACGITWFCLKYHKRPTVPATFLDIVMGVLVGTYIAISKKITIIHSRATVPAVMGYLIAKVTGRKFIFDVRGLMADEYADGGMWERNSFLYKITRSIERGLLKRADRLVVLTENIKGYLTNDVRKSDITVIPCCVDNKRFDRDSGSAGMLREKYKLSGKFVFLYIGSVGTWYLLDEMLDFFIAARNAIRSAHFLVLTHIDQEMVRRACERKHISPDEVTVSCAPFQEMPAHIAMADAGIFFIKPCFSKRSSCPTKYAEYLACGLPVVINAGIGDTDTIVRDRGLGVVVDGFDKSHYDAAVHQLVGLMKDSPAISARCRRAAQELFSLEDGVNKYFNVYRSLPCN